MCNDALKTEYNQLAGEINWIYEYIDGCILRQINLTDEEKLAKIKSFFDETKKGKRENLITLVSNILKEYKLAEKTYLPFNSVHEGYAVILEEVEELKVHVFQKESVRDIEKMKNEALQIAAMSLRFMFDVCPHENDIDMSSQ